MSPLIAIALNLLPDLARRLGKGAKPETQDLVVSIVKDVLGTDDPEEAARRAANSQLAGELRVRLAEIENKAAQQEFEAEQSARQAQLDKLRLEIQDAAAKRDAEFKEFETRLKDQQDARGTFLDLAKNESPFAWGPVVVSVVVTAGFFVTLALLITGGLQKMDGGSDPNVLQIVNISVGALTAGFATVISFWLGSSDGSRRKDLNAFQVQTTAAQVQKEAVKFQQASAQDQRKLTEDLLERVTQQTVVAAAAPAVQATPAKTKDALQFRKCLDLIFAHEGGFVDNPKDPGGATNMGITHITLAEFRGKPVTQDDVRNLTREEASEIYRGKYWNALSCDNLPAGVDLVVFDYGVNSGISRSAKLLQKVVHVEQDGQVGQITVGATKAIEATHIVNAFCDERLEFLRGLDTWDSFKNGWTRRVSETRAAALAMI